MESNLLLNFNFTVSREFRKFLHFDNVAPRGHAAGTVGTKKTTVAKSESITAAVRGRTLQFPRSPFASATAVPRGTIRSTMVSRHGGQIQCHFWLW